MDNLEESVDTWECCSPQPTLKERPLLSEEQTDGLTTLFKTFSNSIRLRLLHALVRAGELCVTDLAKTTELKPQAVSNQLQRLVDRGILASRRQGNNVLYRIVDPCVSVLLDRGLCLLECAAEGNEKSSPQAGEAREDDFMSEGTRDCATGALGASPRL